MSMSDAQPNGGGCMGAEGGGGALRRGDAREREGERGGRWHGPYARELRSYGVVTTRW